MNWANNLLTFNWSKMRKQQFQRKGKQKYHVTQREFEK